MTKCSTCVATQTYRSIVSLFSPSWQQSSRTSKSASPTLSVVMSNRNLSAFTSILISGNVWTSLFVFGFVEAQLLWKHAAQPRLLAASNRSTEWVRIVNQRAAQTNCTITSRAYSLLVRVLFDSVALPKTTRAQNTYIHGYWATQRTAVVDRVSHIRHTLGAIVTNCVHRAFVYCTWMYFRIHRDTKCSSSDT